ncbi:MAG: Monosaccharide transporter rane protein family [Modestobacter sp.]|nr:Monosaccharide transporter rane protein family [Modestobacter sp.]
MSIMHTEQPVSSPSATVGARTSRPFRGFGYKYGVIVVWVIAIVFFSVLAPSTFPTVGNVTSILSAQSTLILLSLAVLPVLATGEIDLSVAGTMTVSATIIGQLNAVLHWPIGIAIVLGFLAALAVGLVNGVLTVYAGVQSIIVTLGMGTLLVGLSVWISNSLTISGVSPKLGKAMNTQVLGVNVGFYVAIVIGIVLWYVYRHTAIGRHIVFIGKNAEVARLSGLPVDRLKMSAFLTTSLLSGAAGVMVIAISGGLQPTSLQTLLLPAFAGAFLGSAILDPGSNNPLGTVIAVLFLATGINGLVLLGADTWIRDVFYGAAVIVAVTVSRVAFVKARTKSLL